MNDFESVESSLKNHLPEGEYEQVRRILYGKDCKGIRSQIYSDMNLIWRNRGVDIITTVVEPYVEPVEIK